jgi:phage shock protein PspC (stress-responsive transcriptional regulator)
MPNAQPSLFTRSDTILGACEGVGEDFGFNAQYLRVALAAMLFWSPVAAFGAYATIALAVLISRWLYPNPSASASRVSDASAMQRTAGHSPVRGENDEQPAELAAAA